MGNGEHETTLLIFAGVYSDVSQAEADYQNVKDLYYELNLIDAFDAAVIAKNESGKVKIHKKHEQPTRYGGWTGAGWGLATGLVIALFPGAAIGGGLLAGATAVGAGVGAIAGHVAAGMNRSDLMELGEEIDIGQSALIVAAAGNISFDVEKVITRADQVFSKEVQIDPDDLAADVDEAKG
jgi:uncharacterized membrane protein